MFRETGQKSGDFVGMIQCKGFYDGRSGVERCILGYDLEKRIESSIFKNVRRSISNI